MARDILDHPTASPIGRVQRLRVAALFADVSGFTRISQALASLGKVGAEEITQVLNSYFAPMIDLVQSYGGIVAKFAGDGITIIFPIAPRRRAATTRRAIQCAVEMLHSMERHGAVETGVGTFSLSMKVGAALGWAFATSVGDPAIRQEHILAGRVLDLCAEAESLAMPGEILVHHDLLRHAGGVRIVEERDGFAVIAGLRRRAARRPLAPLTGPVPERARAVLAAYLHRTVVQRLEDDQQEFLNEHRKVTVLFVNFSDLERDDPSCAPALQAYLLAAMRVIDRYGGYFSWADMGDKGSKFMALFGAPVAHENDEERALQCALDLLTLPHCPVRLGINTGYVYCGVIGSPKRRDYTVMGDAVNLAARLMQAAAPGQILVSGFTQRYAVDRFTWEPYAPIQVKGKSDLIPVAGLLAAREYAVLHLPEPTAVLPMVGRTDELRLAAGKIALAGQGWGQLLGITAEAGMGKSRLSAEIVRLALDRDLTVHGGACRSHGTTTSYLVWRQVWRAFFGLDPSWPSERQIAHLSAQLAAIDPAFVPRMPLLGVVLNIAIPDNELTRALDARVRKESLESLLLDCLGHRAQQTPLLLVLDDCHWIDPLSDDLLAYIGRNLAGLRVLLVLLYRPLEADRRQTLSVTRLATFRECRLLELTAVEAEQLIGLKLARQFGLPGPVPQPIVERVQERCQGNPFFIEEIINYIHDRGIDPRDPRALEQLDLPESLHSLIISRIDRLAEDEKSTLKVASVIGRLFRASWLWQVYPQIGTAEQVQARLDTLSALDLIHLERPEPAVAYLFKHVVTQEVAYESLAIATRATLHELIGSFIEQAYAEELSLFVDMLAFHYGRSRQTDKQRAYFRLAGDAARAAYANQVAIEYYERLLPLVVLPERVAVLCDLGQVYQLIGEWVRAEELYQQALALTASGADPSARARCQLLLGHLMWYKGAYPQALAWLEQARTAFERIGDRRGHGQAIGRMGLVLKQQGDYAHALSYCEQQEQLANDLGDKDGMAEAMGLMGAVFADWGDHVRALECLKRQMALATETGNQRERLYAIGNIGTAYDRMGEYGRALTHHSLALQESAKIGDHQSMTIAAVNMGILYYLQGDHVRALASMHYALDAAIKRDDRSIIEVSLANMAWSYVAQGLYDAAHRLFAQAVALAQALNIPYFLADALYGHADLHARQERYDEAKEANDAAARVAAQIEDGDTQVKTQILSIDLRLALGRTDRAGATCAYEALLGRWPETSHQAAISYALWRLTRSEDHGERAAALYRALYAQTPNVEYRQRLEEITGESLGDPPALPPLPDIMLQHLAPLDALLAEVDARIAVSGEDAEQTGFSGTQSAAVGSA